MKPKHFKNKEFQFFFFCCSEGFRFHPSPLASQHSISVSSFDICGNGRARRVQPPLASREGCGVGCFWKSYGSALATIWNRSHSRRAVKGLLHAKNRIRHGDYETPCPLHWIRHPSWLWAMTLRKMFELWRPPGAKKNGKIFPSRSQGARKKNRTNNRNAQTRNSQKHKQK